MGRVRAGIDCKLYRNTGTWAAPVWNEVTCVSDVSVDASKDFAEANTRATRVKRGVVTVQALQVSGKCVVDDTDEDFIALDDAFAASNPIDMLVLNGPQESPGVRGYRAEFYVTTWKQDQALTAVVTNDFTLDPALTANLPQRAKVTGTPEAATLELAAT